MTNKEILKDITYEFLELPELRQAHILAEHISAARIDIKSKHGYEYGLFYYNYQDKFNLCVADNRDVSPISRYLVRRRIENMVKTKTNRGTNTISLEKAIDSEDIVRFTEECKKNFKEAEIAKLYTGIGLFSIQ